MASSPESLILFTEDELDEFSRFEETVPFVCQECETIGGYYAASFQVVACPHCGEDSQPITQIMRERPL